MQVDQLHVTILDDGRVRIDTDSISPANHLGADELLAFLGLLLGGDTITQPNREREAEITREARRRLGLSEETGRGDRPPEDEPGWPC